MNLRWDESLMLSRNMRLAVVSSLSACRWTAGGRCLLVSDTYPDTQQANEHLVRGHASETGTRLVRRRLVDIAQALKHIKCWGVCGHQETSSVGVSVDTRNLVQTPEQFKQIPTGTAWGAVILT